MLKRTLISIVLAITTATTIAPNATVRAQEASKDLDGLVMPWRFYRRLAKCETALNPNHSTKRYTSAFGIARGTWQRYSHSTSADRYTIVEQARVVDRIAFLGFTDHTGTYIYPAGPYGFATIKHQNCMGLQGFICRSNRPEVKRWKRYC